MDRTPIPSIVGPVFGQVKPPVDKSYDVITWPKHYTQGGVEPIDFITSNSMSFCAGNVVKYVTRYKFKNGVEDLKKAKFYLERLIKDTEGETNCAS